MKQYFLSPTLGYSILIVFCFSFPYIKRTNEFSTMETLFSWELGKIMVIAIFVLASIIFLAKKTLPSLPESDDDE